MNPILLTALFASHSVNTIQVEPIQFLQGSIGEKVTVSIDGTVEKTFAGKLSFQDATHSWLSVCADVRSPISGGQTFSVAVLNTANYGGNVTLAGNIVAKYFRVAQTPSQCAGLQLAVWKALEDGPYTRDFTQGHFRARASMAAMVYAQQYIQGEDHEGNALYLFVQSGIQGSGGGSQGGQSGGGQGGGGGQSQMSS